MANNERQASTLPTFVESEDSNSVFFVDKLSLAADSNFLEKVLIGGLDAEDSTVFKSFLEQNNKYDIRSAAEALNDKLQSVNAGRKLTVILRCQDKRTLLHPLEFVVLNYLKPKIALLCCDGETEFRLHSEQTKLFHVEELSEIQSNLFSSWVSYLTLLVNSRCELSLARTLNVPDRELHQSVFRALKKSAIEKEMPMFQTALSLITQVRLGGKGYRPSSKSAVSQHIKGLGDYVDFVDKLRNHLESYEVSPKIAIKRVLLTLQKEFAAYKSSIEFRPYVDVVYDEMWRLLKESCSASLSAPSPRTPNSGGTLAGREALKLLHRMVIKLNVMHSIRCVNSLNFTSNKLRLNHTPILNAFKSPAPLKSISVDVSESENSPKEEKSQMQHAPKTPVNVLKKSRKSQEMNWAKTPETPFFSARDLDLFDEESSKFPLDLDVKDFDEVHERESQLDETLKVDQIIDCKEENESVESKKTLKKEKGKRKSQSLNDEVAKENEMKNKKVKSEAAIKVPKSKPPPKKKTSKTLIMEPAKGQKTLGMFFKT